MKTLVHLPTSLYSEVVCFAHDLQPHDGPLTLPEHEASFDYERCLKDFITGHPWRSFSFSIPHLTRGKISKREALFCLTVSLAPNAARERGDLERQYPATLYAKEPTDQELQAALNTWCEHYAYYGDAYILRAVALILLGSYTPAQVAKMYLPALPVEDRGEVMMYLAQHDVEAIKPFAVAQLEELHAKPGYSSQLKLQALHLLARHDELIQWFQDDAHKDIHVRTWAMLALAHLDDWPTFRKLAYEDIDYYSPAVLRGHVLNFGEANLDLALEKIEQRWSSTWGCVFSIHHPAITALAIKIATNTQKLPLRAAAQRWLHREGANAIVGALKLWEDEALSTGAKSLLKDYIWRGHGDLVLSLAQEHAPQHLETLEEWAQASPAPDATLPDSCEALEYWFKRGMRHPIPDGIMPPFPILTVDGQPLSLAQVEGLLRLLQDQNKARAQAAAQHLSAAISADSRERLAEHLLQEWFASSCVKRMAWCVEALPKLLPAGLEQLFMSFREQLLAFAQDRQWTYWLKTRTQAYEAWTKLVEVLILSDPSPTKLALCLHELHPPPFSDRWRYPWTLIQANINQYAEDFGSTRYEQLARSILACRLELDQLEHLYYLGLSHLHSPIPVEQWLLSHDALTRKGLSTRALWIASSNRHDRTLIFRVDADGSLLDVHDQPISWELEAISPPPTTQTPSSQLTLFSDQAPPAKRVDKLTHVMPISMQGLTEEQRRAWEQTLSEHELILYQADPSWILIEDSADFDDDDIPF